MIENFLKSFLSYHHHAKEAWMNLEDTLEMQLQEIWNSTQYFLCHSKMIIEKCIRSSIISFEADKFFIILWNKVAKKHTHLTSNTILTLWVSYITLTKRILMLVRTHSLFQTLKFIHVCLFKRYTRIDIEMIC